MTAPRRARGRGRPLPAPPPDRRLMRLPDGRPDEPLLDVLRLVADGLKNRHVAARLSLAEDTVKWRLVQLYRALGVRDRAHAVAEGFRRGYLGDVAHRADCAALRPRTCDCGAAPTETETGG